MKNRTNQILLAVFALSLAAYAAVVTHGSGTPLEMRLVFSLHAVPVFCLQLLLCRRARRWLAAVPGLILLAAVLCFACGWLTTTGWDKLGWAIFFWLSIAPAAGCALAWAVYGFYRLYQRGGLHG